MSKSSFTVYYKLPRYPWTIVLGVTSIMPNLNGFLFNTEDGEGHQIEHYELANGLLPGVAFKYSTEEDINNYLKDFEKSPESHPLFDHRKK